VNSRGRPGCAYGTNRRRLSFLAPRIWTGGYIGGAERNRKRRGRSTAAGVPAISGAPPREIVRIEIAPEELRCALTEEMAREFTAIFKNLGFKFVTLDLEGFRSGSMNQLLPAAELMRGRSKS